MMTPSGDDGVRVAIEWRLAPKRSRGFALPASFTARFSFDDDNEVSLEIAVEDGEPVCNAVHVVRRSGGPSLSGVELRRLPVTKWVALACAEAAMRIDGPGRLVPTDGAEAFDAFARPKRRNQITDERLREVARVCGERQEPGVTRWHVVQDAFHVGRSQAYRLINLAVERGYLDPEGEET